MPRSALRRLAAAASPALLALALCGCPPSFLDNPFAALATRFPGENADVNDGLAALVDRIAELDAKREAEGLSAAEKKELRHLKKANKATEKLFARGNNAKKNADGATAFSKSVRQSGTTTTPILGVAPALESIARQSPDVLSEFLPDDDIPPKARRLERKAEKLFERAIVETDPVKRERLFFLAGRAMTEACLRAVFG